MSIFVGLFCVLSFIVALFFSFIVALFLSFIVALFFHLLWRCSISSGFIY